MSQWLLLALTPVLAFLGALIGHVLTRRASLELDRWRRREETMRMLRWARRYIKRGPDHPPQDRSGRNHE